MADSKKGEDLLVLDVHEICSITSYFVICSGRVDKQVRAIADEIEVKLKGKKITCTHRDDDEDSRWIVLDYFDVIVHVFEKDMREYYKLENLWGDAEEVDWKS